MKSFAVFILLSYLFCLPVFAEQIIDVIYDGKSVARSKNKARQEITNSAVEETSINYIKQFIGEQKTQRNLGLIKNKIIQNSGRYILTTRSDKIEWDKDKKAFVMPVTLKLSMENLKSLLLGTGLLYEADGPPMVLPMISYVDTSNTESYYWWGPVAEGGSNFFLKEQLASLQKDLRREFSRRGFFVVNPVLGRYGELLPAVFNNENLRSDDMLFFGDYLNSQIVIRGAVNIAKASGFGSEYYILAFKLTAYQSVNGRVIAEVTRKYETDPGEFKQVVAKKLLEVNEKVVSDLSTQVLDSWQKGIFGSSLIHLTFKGDLKYKQVEFLKEKLELVSDIKAIRERLFEPGSVTFELDATSDSKKLAEKIKSIDMKPLRIELDEAEPAGVSFNIRSI